MARYALAGRTVVLTGSTGGLGAALARALHTRGARLALLDLDQEAATAQAAALGDLATARAWHADVRDLDGLTATMDEAAGHFGRIDIAVANAGIGTLGSLEGMDPAVYERTIDINLNGVWRTFRAALPHVRARRGYLLATSSMAAFVHSPLHIPYAASKAGVWALCDSLRLELRHLGVDVGSLHPTFFATPMMDAVLDDTAGRILWAGNAKGVWKMVPLATVIDETVKGIERRAAQIVVPRALTPAAKAPGLIRPLVERLGFRGETIPRATEAARPAVTSSTEGHQS
ncbi:SDR family NAD(P)-dependent oxidoreductase [Streptomyces viridiviolaceus]